MPVITAGNIARLKNILKPLFIIFEYIISNFWLGKIPKNNLFPKIN